MSITRLRNPQENATSYEVTRLRVVFGLGRLSKVYDSVAYAVYILAGIYVIFWRADGPYSDLGWRSLSLVVFGLRSEMDSRWLVP